MNDTLPSPQKFDRYLRYFSSEAGEEIQSYMAGDQRLFIPVLNHVLARYAEKPSLLEQPTPELKLNEQVGIDSLTLVELSLLAEAVFNVASPELVTALAESETSPTYGDLLAFFRQNAVPGAPEACEQFGIP